MCVVSARNHKDKHYLHLWNPRAKFSERCWYNFISSKIIMNYKAGLTGILFICWYLHGLTVIVLNQNLVKSQIQVRKTTYSNPASDHQEICLLGCIAQSEVLLF